MVPENGRAARIATIVLMAVAYSVCEVAAHADGRPRAFGIAFGLGVLVASVLLSYLVPIPRPGQRLSTRLAVLLAAGLVLPLAVEPLVRSLTGDGSPLEMQLVNGLRTLGMLLAGFAAWPKYRRLAGVVALFLALFASAMGDQPAIPYLLAILAVVGGLWLILDHRAAHATTAIGTQSSEVERVALKLPYREAIVFGGLAVMAATVAFAGPKKVMLSLGELMPTSGGTGETDPFARYGVGDGPEETAGDNAQAAGMVESDKMIEDNKNSLIDAVSDMYGTPHKPPKNKDQERLVAAGLVDVIQNHKKLPDNRRPSRDFDTGRKGPKSEKKPGSSSARGLFEVEGRTPLHIRVVVYDRYDAQQFWEEAKKPGSKLLDPEGGDWMKIGHFRDVGDWYAETDRHRLKVADLKENLVPTPSMTMRFRIHRVDKPAYYEWDYEGVLALTGRKTTPPGVVVTTECRTLDPERLPESAFAGLDSGIGYAPVLVEVPEDQRDRLAELARAWAGDLAPGWPQIEAILANLRTAYTLDPNAVCPKDHPTPVLWFLDESHRGPDYLFASAAVLMLRSLGYPARLCLGYYADPTAYDPETDHTPVRATDLHFWPEVYLRDGHWLVVEPTPGYAVLPSKKSHLERILEVARAVGGWAARNAVLLAAIALAIALLTWKRKAAIDAAFTLVWQIAPGRTWQQIAFRSLRLLERRTRFAGRQRAVTETISTWTDRLAGGTNDAALARLTLLAESAAYAPNLPPPMPDSAVFAECRTVLNVWTLKRLRQTKSTVTTGGTAR